VNMTGAIVSIVIRMIHVERFGDGQSQPCGQ
jgi:hypothetical protein